MIFSSSKFSRIALAAISLLALVMGGEARADGPLPSFLTSPASPRQQEEFAPVVEPWVPLRRARRGHCADQGGMVLCRFKFLTVRPERILRIDNVSCGGPIDEGNVIQFFILTTSPDFETLEPIAVIPAKQTIDLGEGLLIVANEGGPYFFNAGETVYIFGGGSLGNNSNCMISGATARTN